MTMLSVNGEPSFRLDLTGMRALVFINRIVRITAAWETEFIFIREVDSLKSFLIFIIPDAHWLFGFLQMLAELDFPDTDV
nr:MAG TPA: hypothetical protein [Caudoviricetes sp.]